MPHDPDVKRQAGTLSDFFFARRPYMSKGSLIAGTDTQIAFPSFCETQLAVWPAANDIRIVVVLAVVLPEADGADVEATSLGERTFAAAWAPIGTTRSAGNHRIGVEPPTVRLKPRSPLSLVAGVGHAQERSSRSSRLSEPEVIRFPMKKSC
jgi:hypothetical protein